MHFIVNLCSTFELIFGKSVISVCRSIFARGCEVVPIPFVEETIIALLYYLCPFVKDQLSVFMGICYCAVFCSTDLFAYSFADSTLL